MRTVYRDMCSDPFHTSFPVKLCKYLFPPVHMYLFSRKQIFRRFQCKFCIHRLIASAHRHLKDNIFIIRTPSGKCNIFPVNFPDFIRMIRDFSTIYAQFFSLCSDYFCRFFITSVKEYRNFWLNDSGFFNCDLPDRITKNRRMIQTDRRNDGQCRLLNRICCIQSSAQSGLQDNIFYICFCKCSHPHSE